MQVHSRGKQSLQNNYNKNERMFESWSEKYKWQLIEIDMSSVSCTKA